MMKTVRNIPSLAGAIVLVRAPLNEPVLNGDITSDFRLRSTIPTIKFLTNAGAKVIVCGHIGRSPTETLMPVYRALASKLRRVRFSSESIGPLAVAMKQSLKGGEVLLLENLRQNPGEVGNDAGFARALASLADVFVQDAFDTCHREHASIVGVPKFLPSYAGLLLAEEVKNLSEARTPEHPSLAVIGGAKFDTKEPVIKTLLNSYEHVAVGGALANDFLLAKGYKMGTSRVSGANQDSVRALLKNENLVLPVDVVVAKADEDATKKIPRALDNIGEDESAFDVGEETSTVFASLVKEAKTVLWNGPLGNYEKGFTDGDTKLAFAIAKSSAQSIVGGGDTVSAIESLGISDKFSFVSTGGGAMLDFLTDGTLVGIEALEHGK